MKSTMNPSTHSIFKGISETSAHPGIKQNSGEKKCFNHWLVKQVSGEVQIKLGCLVRCSATAHSSVSVQDLHPTGQQGMRGCAYLFGAVQLVSHRDKTLCSHPPQSRAHSVLPASHSKCFSRESAQGQFSSLLLSWVGWGGRKQLNYKLNC